MSAGYGWRPHVPTETRPLPLGFADALAVHCACSNTLGLNGLILRSGDGTRRWLEGYAAGARVGENHDAALTLRDALVEFGAVELVVET
jgi:hypothetical protein